MLSEIRKRLSLNLFLSSFAGIYRNYFKTKRSRFGYIHKSAKVRFPILIKGIGNVYMYENSHLLSHAKLLTQSAKFIMKKNSFSAEGLTVSTGNHYPVVGVLARDIGERAKDVIVEEDVWLASNVTLLEGVTVGRGAIVGGGAVCRKSVPPYSIVVGNPAKVVGFRFNPEEIIQHEIILYPEDERLSLELLEKNYKKYFLNRLKDIENYLK
jgi:Acetyltransferase (isoleucine patch superfamily)